MKELGPSWHFKFVWKDKITLIIKQNIYTAPVNNWTLGINNWTLGIDILNLRINFFVNKITLVLTFTSHLLIMELSALTAEL